MSKLWAPKRNSKLFQILLTTIELYLRTGQPVGSKTLKEHYQTSLSSATIRNYFAELESKGFLKKNHISGGRIPTDLALRYFVDHCSKQEEGELPDFILEKIHQLPDESKNIVRDLQKSSEVLVDALQLPVCFSAPRFDNDSITNVQITKVDEQRIVFILSTEFGQIFTDVLWVSDPVSASSLQSIEKFLQSCLHKQMPTDQLSSKEEQLGASLYNEILIRYLTRYCNFSEEDLYQTGLSKLLRYEAFKDPDSLATALSFFENRRNMARLLNIGMQKKEPCAFIGNELSQVLGIPTPQCSVITAPYSIGTASSLGAFAILGPTNLPYREVLATLSYFTKKLNESLTRSFYKFKISLRRPCPSDPKLSQQPMELAKRAPIKLLPSKEMS